jgi:hypothetical protein
MKKFVYLRHLKTVMKKVVVYILLILTCSIFVEQYLSCQANMQSVTEINISGNLSDQDFGEQFDNHDFIGENRLNLSLINYLSSENIIYTFNLHPQKSLNYIWQPPEMI